SPRERRKNLRQKRNASMSDGELAASAAASKRPSAETCPDSVTAAVDIVRRVSRCFLHPFGERPDFGVARRRLLRPSRTSSLEECGNPRGDHADEHPRRERDRDDDDDEDGAHVKERGAEATNDGARTMR